MESKVELCIFILHILLLLWFNLMLWSHSTHERILRSLAAPAKYYSYEQPIIIRNTCSRIKISVLSQCLFSLAAYHPKPTKSCLEWRKWLDRAGPLCFFGFLYRLLTDHSLNTPGGLPSQQRQNNIYSSKNDSWLFIYEVWWGRGGKRILIRKLFWM